MNPTEQERQEWCRYIDWLAEHLPKPLKDADIDAKVEAIKAYLSQPNPSEIPNSCQTAAPPKLPERKLQWIADVLNAVCGEEKA